MALPDDLKTKLSIDEDLGASSPKEALSRVSGDRIAMRNKDSKRNFDFVKRQEFNITSGISHSYSTQGDRKFPKLTRLAVNNRKFDERSLESPAESPNQGVITQLLEQISTLSERIEEFTARIEELNSNFKTRNVSASQQNLAVQNEACNGSELHQRLTLCLAWEMVV
ncbi:hypothetical protein IFM89_028647 [Coptis chinensis]|uniref:Uncharacterized protein n=1 Tax=Coptis chinensis TaxID=261450 RepID=A0A835H2Z0_9MAGN|nr:hypothetical protein IFM89_028647 [Coptis chinensis]